MGYRPAATGKQHLPILQLAYVRSLGCQPEWEGCRTIYQGAPFPFPCLPCLVLPCIAFHAGLGLGGVCSLPVLYIPILYPRNSGFESAVSTEKGKGCFEGVWGSLCGGVGSWVSA